MEARALRISSVLEAAIDSWINIEFGSNKGDVFLQMIRNLYQSVYQCLKLILVHRLLRVTCSSKEVSVLLLELSATEGDKANFDAENRDRSFSFGVEDG